MKLSGLGALYGGFKDQLTHTDTEVDSIKCKGKWMTTGLMLMGVGEGSPVCESY